MLLRLKTAVAQLSLPSMPEHHKQVFLTQSPTRWQRFKWTFRILLLVFILLFVILGLAVMKKTVYAAYTTIEKR